MQAAVVLVATALAYIVYMVRAGLGRRVQLDKVRLRGLFSRRGRLGAGDAWLRDKLAQFVDKAIPVLPQIGIERV